MPRPRVALAVLAVLAALVAGCAHLAPPRRHGIPGPPPAAAPDRAAMAPGPKLPACARPIPRRPLTGPGYTALAEAGAGLLAAAADGTVHVADDPSRPILARLPGPVLGLAVAPGGRLVAAVGFGFVARSADGGRHFAAEPLPDDVATFAVAFRGPDLMVLDGAAHLWRVGPGEAITRVATLPPGTRFALAFVSPKVGYAAGGCGHLLKTTDGGHTWQALRAPAASLQGLVARGPTVVVSGTGGAWRSDDGGAHFTRVVRARACVRAAMQGEAIAVACSRLDHALWYAADGRDFREVPTPDAASLLAAFVGPDGELYAGGAHGELLRGSPSGMQLVDRAAPSVAAWLGLLRQYRRTHPPGR